jgi:hypothetical protein
MLNQVITTMSLVSLKPPKFDCEVFSDVNNDRGKVPEIKRTHTKLLVEAETASGRSLSPESACLDFEAEQDEGAASDYYLVFGLSKGNIIFVRLDNLEYIYARF